MTINYFIEASVCSIVIYLIYFLFFKSTRFFIANRFYLLLGMIASMVIPLMDIPLGSDQSPLILSQIIMPETAPEMGVSEVSETKISEYSIVKAIYLLGAIISLLYFGFKIPGILRKRRKFTKGEIQGVPVLFTNGTLPTASFAEKIYWDNSKPYSDKEQQIILNHELVHLKHYHSLDRIFAQMYSILFWFNPASYLIGSALKIQHEFQADQEVSNNINSQDYIKALINGVYRNSGLELINHFSQFSILNRIKMLNHKKQSPTSKWRYSLIIPTFLLLVYTFGCEEQRDTSLAKPEIKSIRISGNIVQLTLKDGSSTEMTSEEFRLKKEDYIYHPEKKEFPTFHLSDAQFTQQGAIKYKAVKFDRDAETIGIGVIYDLKGNPVVGASIVINGTTMGTVTNVNGEFMIKKPMGLELFEITAFGKNRDNEKIEEEISFE